MNNDKFIPVVFKPDDTAHILKWLKPASHHVVSSDEGYEFIAPSTFNDLAVEKPPLSKPEKKGPNQ